MKIDSVVIDVLKQCEVNGLLLTLPRQLDRKIYEKTAKILKSLGGKWNSNKKAFVFNEDVGDIITQIADTGEYIPEKVKYQFFPTPDDLARHLVSLANIRTGELCLEPSAGRGAIARHLPSPLCVELDPINRKFLTDNGFNVVHDDFLTYVPQTSPDVIVMNPPFAKCQDAIHIAKAIEMANRCVVAVASSSVAWKNNRNCQFLRDLILQFDGTINELPAGSFKDSGTAAKTVVIVVEKH